MSDKQDGRNINRQPFTVLENQDQIPAESASQSKLGISNTSYSLLHFHRQVHRCSIRPFFAICPLTDVHYVDGGDDDYDVFLPFPLTEFLLLRHLRAIAGFL